MHPVGHKEPCQLHTVAWLATKEEVGDGRAELEVLPARECLMLGPFIGPFRLHRPLAQCPPYLYIQANRVGRMENPMWLAKGC